MSTPNETLFNCQPSFMPPDWTKFDAIEVQPVLTFVDDSGDTVCEVAHDVHEAEFWTVYGHCKTGGVEALTDVSTERLAQLIAEKFRNELTAGGAA